MTTIEDLKEAHDIVKTHPFRRNFDDDLRMDYIHILHDLSRKFSDYVYHGPERDRLIKSALFIHNFNACLLRWRNGNEYNYLIGYYDQMLGVIHRFVETGELPCVYNLEKDKESNTFKSVKYVLVTKEEYPGESKYVPGYFQYCEDLKTDVTVEEIYGIYKKCYAHLSDEDLRRCAEAYVNDEIKVLKYVKDKKGSL